MMLLDMLDNLPRMHISDALMKLFIWVLKETGASDVPSFYMLRKTQGIIRKNSNVPTIKCTSPLGNTFYVNDPRHIIAQVSIFMPMSQISINLIR